jgi:hypothetical protein
MKALELIELLAKYREDKYLEVQKAQDKYRDALAAQEALTQARARADKAQEALTQAQARAEEALQEEYNND